MESVRPWQPIAQMLKNMAGKEQHQFSEEEVRDQNKYLSDMDDEFDNAGGFLGKAMSRVKRLGKGSHNHVVLYLLGFSLCVFLFIWLLLKFS